MFGLPLVFGGLLLAGPADAATTSVTVSPSSGLRSGQSVTVTATGYPANASVAIAECAPIPAGTSAVASEGYCGISSVQFGTTDASGSLTATFTVQTGKIGTNSASLCPPANGSCDIQVAQPSTTPAYSADAPISFGSAVATTTTTRPATATTTAAPSRGAGASSDTTTTVAAATASGSSNSTTGSGTSASGSSGSGTSTSGSLAYTGVGSYTWLLAGAGLLLVYFGYLAVSATWIHRGAKGRTDA